MLHQITFDPQDQENKALNNLINCMLHTNARALKDNPSDAVQPLLVQLNISLPLASRIGIPTMEGVEYFLPADIIYCEGKQSLTRVVTMRGIITSSYHIGKFISVLEPFGFFATHKSYLINLAHVVRYHKEGTICLAGQHNIPVSRRRRSGFLERLPHV